MNRHKMKNIFDFSVSTKKKQSRSKVPSLQMFSIGPSIQNHHHSSYSNTLPTTTETPIGLKTKKKMQTHNRNSIFNSIFVHLKKTSEELTSDIAEAKKISKIIRINRFRSASNPNPNYNKHKKLISNQVKNILLKEKMNQLQMQSIDLKLSSLDNKQKQSKESKTSLPIVSVNNKQIRTKTFVVQYNPKWSHIEEMAYSQVNHLIINDIEIQRHIIRDQITLLLDNIQTYKLAFFSHNKIKEFFDVLSPIKQRELNKLIEEIISLMIEISYLILMDLSKHIDKFIVNPQKRFTKEDDAPVYKEADELNSNAKLFNEASMFLKACNEVYDSASKEESDFVFSKKIFQKVLQFLERCRLDISKLLVMTRNLYANYLNDLTITKRYSIEMRNIEEASSRNSKANTKDNDDYYTLTQKNESISRRKNKYSGGIDYTNYKGPLKVQISEEKDKIQRMDKVLGKVNDNCLEKKKDKIRKQLKNKFDINSRLIDIILKYSTAEFRNKIQSERVMMRFREKETQGINYDY